MFLIIQYGYYRFNFKVDFKNTVFLRLIYEQRSEMAFTFWESLQRRTTNIKKEVRSSVSSINNLLYKSCFSTTPVTPLLFQCLLQYLMRWSFVALWLGNSKFCSLLITSSGCTSRDKDTASTRQDSIKRRVSLHIWDVRVMMISLSLPLLQIIFHHWSHLVSLISLSLVELIKPYLQHSLNLKDKGQTINRD